MIVPKLWNELLLHIRQTSSVLAFKSLLKIHLLSLALTPIELLNLLFLFYLILLYVSLFIYNVF